MKLTNKQLNLVVDMIFDQVKESIDKSKKIETDRLSAIANKIVAKSSFYVKIQGIFAIAKNEVYEIKVKDKVLEQYYPRI